MSDIFLSYANVDLPRVQPLITVLEEYGWSVWWDRTILPGKTYDQVIEEALEATRCVLVVWSTASIASGWVRAEADEGRQRGRLVPVLLEDGLRLPIAFRQIQAANLVDWRGEQAHAEFGKVVRALIGHLGPPPVYNVPPLGSATPVEPPATPSAPPDIGALPEPPPVVAQPPPRPEPRVPQPRPVPGKKTWLWGLAVVLLLSLPILYQAFQGSGESPPRVPAPAPPVIQQFALAPTVKNSLGMEFVLINAGEFRMGSANGDTDELPVHTVRISRPFYLGKYEVTQAQWQAVMGKNPSFFTGDGTRPVEQVSWEDVQQFIGKLNAKEGVALYRLPTEAEWEYAAQAGTTTAYSFGDDPKQLPDYAWYSDNAGGKTQPIGQRKPNPWGLYDMHGNVWEWVQDWKGAYAADTVTDPPGPSSGSSRVIRGGSWYNGARHCRSAYRHGIAPGRSWGPGAEPLAAVQAAVPGRQDLRHRQQQRSDGGAWRKPSGDHT